MTFIDFFLEIGSDGNLRSTYRYGSRIYVDLGKQEMFCCKPLTVKARDKNLIASQYTMAAAPFALGGKKTWHKANIALLYECILT
jgi:hypothetical protein